MWPPVPLPAPLLPKRGAEDEDSGRMGPDLRAEARNAVTAPDDQSGERLALYAAR